MASEVFAGVMLSVKPCPEGRRLELHFIGTDKPQLDRLVFKADQNSPERFLQRGFFNDAAHAFRTDKVSKAMGQLFLDYLCACFKHKGYLMQGGQGSLAASLGYAIDDPNRQWSLLFMEDHGAGQKTLLAKTVFGGSNFNGKGEGARVIYPNPEQLPTDCIKIFWNRQPLAGFGPVQTLADRYRKGWGLPPAEELDLPQAEEPQCKKIQPEPPREPEATKPKPPPEPIASPKPAPQEPSKQPELEREAASQIQSPAPAKAPTTADTTTVESQKAAAQAPPEAAKESEQAAPKDQCPAPSRIEPHLFEVPESGGCWPDDMSLLNFSDAESSLDWTLQHAFEGVLIMGATGSGKTSGSGTLLAETFINSGFGGLVLTVKKDEVEHWQRLCQRCGREKDLVIVRLRGDWKLNLLAYESQRPGGGGGLANSLVSFCRNLLTISQRSRGTSSDGEVWRAAGDELLNSLFELFMLSGVEITFDRLHDFIADAPAEKVDDQQSWRKSPLCWTVLSQAERNIKSQEDLRLFERAKKYWFKIYPGLPGKTRSSVTLGIFAMLDAFRGRDVPALISSDTNITPETIMSGMIVVLDLPIKEYDQTGLLVQSAWKYLFQKAVERRAMARQSDKRPCFLWEDEGQYFYSDHDDKFQDTARSARVSRVILTQNINGYLKIFGREGQAAAYNVFGNLNTKIFHFNTDNATNEWASKLFGNILVSRTTTSSSPSSPPRGAWESFVQQFDPPRNTSSSKKENWEPAVQPNEFLKLRNGGRDNQFLVDAYLTWQGLASDSESHFTKAVFEQPHTEEP